MQTWKTATVPAEWAVSPASIRRTMPDWELVLMTDADNLEMVRTHFPQYLDVYNGFPYAIQRVDMARVMWLYLHGGLYMDLDYEVNKSLEPLFLDGGSLYVVQSSNVKTYFTNSVMASIPQHPFWLEYLEHMAKPPGPLALTKHLVVMTTTGPSAISEVIDKTAHVYSVMPQHDLIPCSVCDESTCVSEGYLTMIKGGSWNGLDTKILNTCMCTYKRVGMWLLLALVLLALFVYVWSTKK